MFAGGDVMRPHLLTTAIGHGAIAADGIDRFLSGEELEKRPKIDVHVFDLQRKMVEKGLKFSETHEPIRGTDSSNVAHPQLRQPLRPLRDPARGAVPRPLRLRAAQQRATSSRSTREWRSATSRNGWTAGRSRGRGRSQALHELRHVLRMRQLRGLLPADRGAQGAKKEATTGRYVYTDYDKCIGCHICKDVCPTGYIQMGLGE